MPKISIIMPVYNVEKYISKTIESVLNQTFKDFEFFAVDDGSTDNSGKICDSFAYKDTRLKVIHKKNEGAPKARNVAIEKASGKYMYFIDSDDWIENDMLEKMYDLAEKNEADLVVTGFAMEYYQNGKEITFYNKADKIVYDNQKSFRANAYKYFNNSLLSLPWNKLYKTAIIKNENIRFPDTKWDDHHFNMDYLMNVKKVVISDIAKYHWYRSRKGSETMINYNDPNMFEKRKEHFNHILKLYSYWNQDDKKSIDAISCYYVGRIVQCIQELVDNEKMDKKEIRNKIKKIISDKETQKALKKAKGLSFKFKILSIPLKIKNTTLSIFEGKFLNLIRNKLPILFIKMKEKEVHSN